MVDLSKYTRAELLWIIDRACQLGLHESNIRIAVRDLEHEREQKILEEADQLNHLAYNKRMERIDLMRSYEGWKIKDIPLEVLNKVDAAMQEAQEAERKWKKLMMPKKKR